MWNCSKLKSYTNYSWTIVAIVFLSACGDSAEITRWEFQTTEVTSGDVQKIVRATGHVIPKNQVIIGSEVSGKVVEVFVDYNSVVKKGDILAKIDLTNFSNRVQQIEGQIESSQADIDVQKANIERARIALENATQQFNRQTELYKQEAISVKQLELAHRDVGVAEANLKLANAQLRSNEARRKQLRSTLATARTELGRTTIKSPIDGIVIERKIDTGQTVQSSFSTPELFTIAADLSKIDIHAQIVESDVGGLEEGDPVIFTVDAYPNLQVEGRVEQLRVKGKEKNGIVSYVAVIGAENPGRKLMPGMTANLRITSEVRKDIVRVSVDAERFRPSIDEISALEKRETVTLDTYEIKDDLEPYYERLRKIEIGEDRIESFKKVAKERTNELQRKIKDPAMAPEHAAAKRSLALVVEQVLQGFLSNSEFSAYEGEVALERNRRKIDFWVPLGQNKIARRTVTLGLIDESFAEIIDGLEEGDKVITKITKKSVAE